MAKQEKEKTGYEGTGAADTFDTIESEDLELPGMKKESEEKKEPEKEPEKKPGEDPSPEEIEAKEKEEQEKLDAEKKKLAEDAEDDMKFLKDDDKDKEKEKETEKEKELDEDDPDKLFDVSEMKEKMVKEDEAKKASKNVDFTKIADGIELPGDIKLEVEENSVAGFQKAISKALDAVKEVKVFNLDEFEGDKRTTIEYFDKGGTLKDLLTPLKQWDDVLLLPDEEKVKQYLINAEEKGEQEADDLINDMITEDKLDDKVAEIDKKLYSARENSFQEIISNSEKNQSAKAQSLAGQMNTLNEEMIEVIDKTKSFMGMKLPKNLQEVLKMEVETGRLTGHNLNAKTQVKARLFDLYGEKILKILQNKAKSDSRDGYNKGQLKEKQKLHNIEPDIDSPEARERKESPHDTAVDPLKGMLEIEKDLIEGVE